MPGMQSVSKCQISWRPKKGCPSETTPTEPGHLLPLLCARCQHKLPPSRNSARLGFVLRGHCSLTPWHQHLWSCNLGYRNSTWVCRRQADGGDTAKLSLVLKTPHSAHHVLNQGWPPFSLSQTFQNRKKVWFNCGHQ